MPVDSIVYSYIASEESYPDKAVLIEENVTGDWICVILQGRVKVKKQTAKGLVTIYTLKEGDVFGEMALFGKKRGTRRASVIADGPVEIGILDKERLNREFESLSPQLKDLIRTLVTRLADTNHYASLMAVDQITDHHPW